MIGPLYGAVVLAVADWEAIFWLNLAVGLVLAAALTRLGTPAVDERRGASRPRVPDPLSLLLLVVALVSLVLLLWEPAALVSDITLGIPFVPVTGESRWLTPLALVAVLSRGRARGPLPRRRASAGRPARLGGQLPAGRPARGGVAWRWRWPA